MSRSPRLDPVIHPPKRLRAMAVLAHAASVDFTFLRDHLAISDSDLSKQMSTLTRAGYVTATKSGRGPGGATIYQITRAGRAAFDGHVAALDTIVSGPAAPSSPDRS